MALTPDDVVHKEFQLARGKDGLDPDEVDDYLDEIVVEWRRLLEENAALKGRVAELEAALAAGSAVAAPVPAMHAPEVASVPPQATMLPAESGERGDASTGIIAVAQRVHDEYISEGRAKGRELIADAEVRAGQILAQAEAHHRSEMARLQGERESLNREVAELREFESNYRKQLRGYFEGQLRQLDSPNPSAGAGAALGL
jgi:DivIVA domain-containing protein